MGSVALVCAACVAVMMFVTREADSRSATARMRARSWPGALTYTTAAAIFFAAVLS